VHLLFARGQDHSFTCARGEQAKRLRGEQEKRWSSVMQDDKLPPAAGETKIARPQQPNVYLEPKLLRCAEDQGKEVRAKMATVTRGPRQGSTHAACPLIKSQLYMCMGRREEVSCLREEQESVGRQGCKMPHCHTR
jgi:hypothetical protein